MKDVLPPSAEEVRSTARDSRAVLQGCRRECVMLLAGKSGMAVPKEYHRRQLNRVVRNADNSLISHSVLPVLFLRYWSFQLYISL